MDQKEYYQELLKIRASRINQITNAVNCKVPKEEIGLKSEVEEMYYDSLITQVNEHLKKYGSYPIFEMEEIESDDPCLDIYKEEV